MARIDPDDPRPPYLQIADDLRRVIRSGKLAPGKRLDSSRELAAAYGVAPMTVHQAMRVLRDEGLVESWQGRGVFVRTDAPPQIAADLPSEVAAIRRRVDELAAQVSTSVSTDVADLKRQVGALQAHLMELYARTGQPYPHDTPQTGPSTGRGRKASGA